eukprot:Nitzschia sp. Nitz4//scaffold26_size159584//55341//56117//NITZ4_002483-RA/size159584-processed-gene-0.191-mRNA-1//1//CDS//3329545058//6230//frame0
MKEFFEIPDDQYEAMQEVATVGTCLVIANLLFTMVLDLLSYETVLALWKQPGGKELYYQGWILNIINQGFIGVPIYVLAGSRFCVDEEPTSILQSAFQILWILFVHSLQYYVVHKAFHDYPVLYQWFHRFHHRFHVNTPPSAANAVAIGEYLLAYILPFLPALLTQPIANSSLRIGGSLLGLLNILLHFPRLEALGEKYIPWFWVSPGNHLEHHRHMVTNFAAPTFNLDRLVGGTSSQGNTGRVIRRESESVSQQAAR